jgi:O-succinylbenzoate synthase
MKIERVEFRRVLLPYVAPFETSGWRETGSYAIIVKLEAEGITAWGESPVGPASFLQ